jgi:WD40 repeat protein
MHGRSFITELKTFVGHDQMITDACEVTLSGFIATSSLDGKIKLWDIQEPQLMTELEDGSVKKGRSIKGVRGLTYTPDYGGNL